MSGLEVAMAVLEKELATYAARKQELLASSAGKFVLIHEELVIGIYDAEMDAIREGLVKFRNEPFLVRKIEAFEPVLRFASTSFVR